jgi:hypothetical protein
VGSSFARRGTGGGGRPSRFLARDEAPVERLTDKGVRRFDARAAVLEMM